MKREIKFRLFHKVDGMKYCGDLMAFMLLDSTWKLDDGKDVLIARDCGYIPMQYTGIKDFDGREIYEGDFVKYKSGIVKQIWFKDGAFRTNNSKGSSTKSSNNLHSGKVFNLQMKIIGNVYENPELLKSDGKK